MLIFSLKTPLRENIMIPEYSILIYLNILLCLTSLLKVYEKSDSLYSSDIEVFLHYPQIFS